MTPDPTEIPARPDGFAGTIWDFTYGAGQKASKIIEARATIEDIKGSVSKDAVYFIQFMDDVNKLSLIMENVNTNLELLNKNMATLLPKKED